MFTLSLIVHSLGITIVLCSLVLVGAISFTSYEERYSRYTKKTTTEANREMIPVTAVMIALGAIAFILCIVYLITLCRISVIRPQTAIYNGGATIYPPNLSTPNTNLNSNVTNFQSPYPPPYTSNEPLPVIPKPLHY